MATCTSETGVVIQRRNVYTWNEMSGGASTVGLEIGASGNIYVLDINSVDRSVFSKWTSDFNTLTWNSYVETLMHHSSLVISKFSTITFL